MSIWVNWLMSPVTPGFRIGFVLHFFVCRMLVVEIGFVLNKKVDGWMSKWVDETWHAGINSWVNGSFESVIHFICHFPRFVSIC